MTTEHEASRTLVKSPPELWAECSDAGSLARHLGEFGEIRITRLEPETAVAWEGERASGTVRIEPSAWGTRVTLTASTEAEEVTAAVEEAAVEEEPPVVSEELAVVPEEPAVVPEEPAVEEPRPVAEPESVAAEVATAVEESAEVPEAPPSPRRRPRLVARVRAFFRPATVTPVPAIDVEAEPAVEEAEPVIDAAEPATPQADPEPAEAEPEPAEAEPEPAVEPEPEHSAPSPSDVALSRGVGHSDSSSTEPTVDPEASLDAEPTLDAEAVLTAALDSLGQAHHRPFSRA
jgi:hypothetical protein